MKVVLKSQSKFGPSASVRKTLGARCCCALGGMFTLLALYSPQLAPAEETTFAAHIEPFIKQHCLKCHGEGEPEGEFSLLELPGEVSEREVEKWRKVAERLQLGEMPPAEEPRPNFAAQQRVMEWIAQQLRARGAKLETPDKLLLPSSGNRVPHAVLFDRELAKSQVTATPARLWRMNPYVYNGLVDALSRRKDLAQPFAYASGEGFRDYAALYKLDEPTTDLLIRNAHIVAEAQLFHTQGAAGKLQGGWRTLKEALVILDVQNLEPSDEQLAALVRRQFQLVLQREPSEEEAARFLAFAKKNIATAGRQPGLQTTLAAVMLLPEAVFRTELGGGERDENGRELLAPRELAYAISFALTDARPDDALLQAAARGELKTKADAAREVRRLLNQPLRKNPRLCRFFEEFFGYRAAVDVFKDNKENPEHEADILVGDTELLIEYVLERDKNVFYELLTTNKSFVNARPRGDGFERVNSRKKIHLQYSLPDQWKWTAEQPIELPREERAGILTQPSWLVAHSSNFDNHAIRRGKWVREHLLGGVVPDLPVTVDAQLPEDATKTLRERMEVTRANYCWNCHEKMNPLGLTFETFDHFGRFRTEELAKPVNATGRIAFSGDAALDGEVPDALAMIHKLAASERVQQVFVRHAFRYFLGRNETPDDAGTLIAASEAYTASGGSFQSLVESLLTSDTFIYRWPLPEEPTR